MTDPRRHPLEKVHGDQLVARLRADAPFSKWLRVEPPPASWADVKPALSRALDRLRADLRRPPLLSGVPRCAGGADFRAWPIAPSPIGRELDGCRGCTRRADCSPPSVWDAAMSPFGPTDPLVQWDAWHRGLVASLDVPRDARLDAAVRAHLAELATTHADAPITLEPSITLGPRVERSVRLAIFHGKLPTAPAAAAAAHDAQLRGFAKMHDAIGAAVPRGLVDALRRAGPMQTPVGFDARPGLPISLKAYARVQPLSPDARAALLDDLCALATDGWSPDATALARSADMIGVTTVAGEIDTVKAYVPADPARGWPDRGLPAIPTAHPFSRLSGGVAYAVLDLRGPTRAPKWDFHLRTPLLSPVPTRALIGELCEGPAVDEARALLSGTSFRWDVVAGALRDRTTTLYLDLS